MNNLIASLQDSTYITIEDAIYYVDFDNNRVLKADDNYYSEIPLEEQKDNYTGVYYLEGYDSVVRMEVNYRNQQVFLQKQEGVILNFALEGK